MNNITIWDKREVNIDAIVLSKHFKIANGKIKTISIMFKLDTPISECVSRLKEYYELDEDRL